MLLLPRFTPDTLKAITVFCHARSAETELTDLVPDAIDYFTHHPSPFQWFSRFDDKGRVVYHPSEDELYQRIGPVID